MRLYVFLLKALESVVMELERVAIVEALSEWIEALVERVEALALLTRRIQWVFAVIEFLSLFWGEKIRGGWGEMRNSRIFPWSSQPTILSELTNKKWKNITLLNSGRHFFSRTDLFTFFALLKLN